MTQLCSPQLALPLRKLDLRQQMRESADDPTIWRTLLAEYEHQVFDMEQGPLLRAQLLQLSDERTILQIVIHHFLVDGTAIAILFAELSALYANPKVELAPQPIQLADYLLWEAAHGSAAEVENYWLNYLSPLPPNLVISQVPDVAGQECTSVIGAHVLKYDNAALTGFQQLAQQQNSTLFMLMMAVFVQVLARHSNESEVTLCYPMANRSVPGTETLVTCLANILPMRVQCNSSSSLQEVLPQIQTNINAALKYSNLALPSLLEKLGLPISERYHPLLQVIFFMEESVTPVFDGLQVQALPGNAQRAKYDLLLYVQLSNSQLGAQQMQVIFLYHPAAFTRATVELLAQEMHHLLSLLIPG